MKKLFVIFLSAAVLFGFAACSYQQQVQEQAAEMYQQAQEEGAEMYARIQEVYEEKLKETGGDVEKALELTNEELGISTEEISDTVEKIEKVDFDEMMAEFNVEESASATASPKPTSTSKPTSAPTPEATPTPKPSASAEETKPAVSDNPNLTNIDFKGDVKDDVTGKWRFAIASGSEPIENYAADYYKEYFTSDDEIHAVINKDLGTTARVVVLYPGMLCVSVLEYIDGEENSAKPLFSGDQFEEFWVNTETGEIEEIDLDE